MSSSQLIGEWASGVWFDIGQPSNVSALAISGFACSPNTLGRLNVLIGECFSGSGFSGPGTFNYDVSPCIGQNELALVEQIYLIGWWNNLAQATMGGGTLMAGVAGAPTTPATTLFEGDTRIAFASPAAIGAVYATRAKEASDNLKYLVNVYINQIQGANVGRSVNLFNLVYPTNAYGGFGGYGGGV